MISLMLNVVFCSAITLWLKYGEQLEVHSNTVTLFNYIIASLGGLTVFFVRGGLNIVQPLTKWLLTILFACVTGFIYLVTIILIIKAIAKNGAGVCTLWAKAGILIPIFTSLILWGENPSFLCWIGVIITMSAIFLVSYEGGALKPDRYLVLLLISSGAGGTMLKIFQKVVTIELNDFFVFCTFTVSTILSYIWTKRNGKIVISKKNVFIGGMVGISNALADIFIMISLTILPAPVVYPVSSSGTISLIAIVSAVVFREKLTKKQIIAIILTMIGIILIDI